MILRKQQNRTAMKHQTGGALLVAMILIFMLSIMGVTTMQGSTLERRMATNSIQTATTFHGSESTSELALNDPALMTQAINVADVEAMNLGDLSSSASIPYTADLLHDIGMDSDAVIQYVGKGPAYGYSAGMDSSTFAAYRFVVEGNSAVDSIRAKKLVVQGAYRIAPGTNK